MYNNLKMEQVDVLVKAGIISEDKREAASQVILDWWKDRMAILWEIGDVRSEAEGMEPPVELTDEECREILAQVLKYNDANIGVTWETLRFYIREHVGSRKG